MNLFDKLNSIKKERRKEIPKLPTNISKPEYKLNKPEKRGKGFESWRKYCRFTLFALELFEKFWNTGEEYSVLLISTHNKDLWEYWEKTNYLPLGKGRQKQVSQLIKFMSALNLIKVIDNTYSKNLNNRYCKRYIAYTKNINQFINDMKGEYNMLYKSFSPTHAHTVSVTNNLQKSINNRESVEKELESLKEKVKLCTQLKIYNMNKGLANKIIMFNYPQIQDMENMQLNYNGYYSQEQHRDGFTLYYSLTPHITRNNILTKFGCRAFTYLGCEEKKTRQKTLDKYNLTKHYDITSSVPRITYSINHGCSWLDEDIDIYEAIKNKISIDNPEIMNRKTIKLAFLRCYFENSEERMFSHLRHDGVELTDEERNFLSQLFTAVRETIGEPLNNEVFLHESYIMIQLTGYLLEQGWLTLNVYDSVYCDSPLPQEEFVKLCRGKIREYFEDYCRRYLI